MATHSSVLAWRMPGTCCGEGGRLQTNITGLFGECLLCMDYTEFAPAHGVCAFLVYTAQAPGCSTGNCPKLALGFVYFPGLTCSGLGSWVLHKGTDSFGHDFCALPRSKQLRQPGAWQAHSPRWVVHLNHLPGPSRSASWVHHESTVSGLPRVSSEELISGCDPPGGC